MSQYQVCLVDDEKEILEGYEDFLKDDFDVKSFSSSAEFLRALENKKINPDIVLSDFNMPQYNGLAMIEAANKLGYFFPFILLSAYLDKDVAVKAVNDGAYRLLEKPVDFETIKATIDQLLIEFEVQNTRAEIRELTLQLREFYTNIRLIMDQYIPPEVMKKILVDPTSSDESAKSDFNEVILKIENRLDQLFHNEQLLSIFQTHNTNRPQKKLRKGS